MKTLIVLSAMPGCGKSTWADNYQKEHENTYIVSSDEIRREITGCYTDFSHQKEVWPLFDKRIKEYASIENATVILDALNDLNLLRKKYVTENPEFDKYILILFPKSKEEIEYWNKQRRDDKVVCDDALQGLINKFELPDEETLKLFDEVLEIKW